MSITVVGTGYVGLVTGACFAEMGNTVTCVDIDSGKIDRLKQGILSIYEPGLDDVVARNFKSGRLRFTSSLAEAISDSDVFSLQLVLRQMRAVRQICNMSWLSRGRSDGISIAMQ